MTVELHVDGNVATLSWKQVGRANAIGHELAEHMTSELVTMHARDDIDIIVLRSESGHFCAGWDTADFDGYREANGVELEEQLTVGRRLLEAVDACAQLTVGTVTGAALGFGTSLLAHCDIVLAEPDARFGFVEVCAGVVPTLVAPDAIRLLGEHRARAWLTSGSVFDAEAARAAGLVTEITVDLPAAVADLVRRADGAVMKATKRYLATLTALAEPDRAAHALECTVENFRKATSS